MAKAKKEAIPQPAYRVTLELSDKEAQTILDIMHFIGGCPETTPRMHADSIRRALEKCGVERECWPHSGGGIDYEKPRI
jgi:hypothetical protein